MKGYQRNARKGFQAMGGASKGCATAGPLLIFAAATNEYYRMYIGAHHDDATTTSSMRSSPILDKERPQSMTVFFTKYCRVWVSAAIASMFRSPEVQIRPCESIVTRLLRSCNVMSLPPVAAASGIGQQRQATPAFPILIDCNSVSPWLSAMLWLARLQLIMLAIVDGYSSHCLYVPPTLI